MNYSETQFLDVDFPTYETYPVELNEFIMEKKLQTNADNISDEYYSPKTSFTRKVVSHALQFNQSYKCIEQTAELINTTPGSKIRVPSSIYKIKKHIPLKLEPQYYINCGSCKVYSPTTTPSVTCDSCAQVLKRSTSKYFVYFPLRPQLIKSIHDNFDKIIAYDKKFSETNDIIRDLHDCIIYKLARASHPNSIILPIAGNTDGAKIFKSRVGSVWPLQIAQCFLPPNMRYITENIILAAVHEGKIHFESIYSEYFKNLIQPFFDPPRQT